MHIELKQAAQQALDAFDAFGDADDFASLFELTKKMHALRTAIQQAEAQQPATAIACGIPGMAKTTCPYCEQGFAFEHEQPATGETVAWLYVEDGEVMFGHPNGYRPADARPLVFGDTRPAPSVPKDDQIAALVNKVRDIARMFHDHQSLRERIAIELVPALKASQEVKSNAERWRHAISDGGNQSMNFLDIFDDWDGDGDFVEAFDAAMLAANEGGK